MKFFAPKNEWNVTAPGGGWFGLIGQPTAAGIRVTPDVAMTFSAWFCGVRIISETLASLPCNLFEQQDERTRRKAADHPLYYLLHDEPNPEQDSMSWFDMQTAFLPNWGDSYSEIQRNSLGEIVALWPIHPSRLPLRNIRRNGTNPDSWRDIVAGQPGEIVYYANNDDGTATAIPASDMLHVPGVLSSNGITGQSIMRWGSNSIGIALATERHAGAVFKNGAVTNMAIKSPKIVGKETAERLRQQWQQTFAGSENHYKTLILEEGMEPFPIDMDPEKTQLILARKFGVTESARFLRLPPHMLADLEKASFSNIEQQSLEFVVYSMTPWIVRWEKAMNRQLLKAAEKKRYRFMFNVTALLRGDSAARAAFYQAMFQMGVYSPNDIRAHEDENPIDGGDVHFIPANNLMPLDKVQEMAQATIDKLEADAEKALMPPPAPAAPAAPASPADPGTNATANALAELGRVVIEQEGRVLRAVNSTPTMDELRSEVAQLIAQREAQDAANLEANKRTLSEGRAAAAEAIQLGIQAAMEGLVARECRALKQASKKPQTFLTWRDEFYPEFTQTISGALSPFATAAQKIGIVFDAGAAAGSYATTSVAALEPLADMPCNEFDSGIERLTETWATRARDFTDDIFTKAS